MDYLDRLLQLTQIEGEINVLCRFQGAWQVVHQKTANALGVFHIISKGACCVQFEGQSYNLTEGDVLFLPDGIAHTMSSCDETQAAASINRTTMDNSSTAALTLHTNCQTSHDFEMFCGYFCTVSLPFLPLPKWHLSNKNQSVISLLRLLQAETRPNLASKAVIDSLCNVLFTYLIRDYLLSNKINSGIVAALQDKRLFHAVNAMLKQPERDWNMESLANLSSISRAGFIRLFKQKTGELPGKMLLELRMYRAKMLLKQSNKSVFAVALDCGYRSESHFCKIFKQYFGKSPSQCRIKEECS